MFTNKSVYYGLNAIKMRILMQYWILDARFQSKKDGIWKVNERERERREKRTTHDLGACILIHRQQYRIIFYGDHCVMHQNTQRITNTQFLAKYEENRKRNRRRKNEKKELNQFRASSSHTQNEIHIHPHYFYGVIRYIEQRNLRLEQQHPQQPATPTIKPKLFYNGIVFRKQNAIDTYVRFVSFFYGCWTMVLRKSQRC